MHPSSLFSSVILAIAATTIAAPIPWDNDKKGSNVEAGGGGQAQGGDVNGGYKSGGCDECDREHGWHGGLLGALGGPLLNIGSGNGGDGGNADGGNALLDGFGLGNDAHTVKGGPGGNAKGGDVNGPAGLLNIISNNAGNGGHANGGDAALSGNLLGGGGKHRGNWGDNHDGPNHD